MIYQHVADFLVWAADHVPSMRWSVENPQHSYFWLLPPVNAIWARQVQINFSSCRHGGSRNKATTFLCNNTAPRSMCGGCPGNHSHLAWSQDSSGYDTAKEAEYPELLCQRFADCVDSVTDLSCSPSQATEQARASNQHQPRMSRMPPVVSEFAYTQRVSSAEEPPLDNRRLTSTWLNVPKGSKLLRSGLSEAGVPFLIFGIYRSPSQFLSDALLVEHPFYAASALPDDMLRAVFLTLIEGPLATMKHRLKTIQRWREMATRLEVEEAALRATMDPIVSSVLKGKRLLLLREIGKELGWPDENLFADLTSGFKLTGTLRRTGVFEPATRPPTSSEEELWTSAREFQDMIWEKVEAGRCNEYDDELWDITMAEAGHNSDKHWLEGPLSRNEVTKRFGNKWIPCRRFAVWQNKWRPIDDFSESGINKCWGAHEKITLRALDEAVHLTMQIMRAASHLGAVKFKSRSGAVLQRKVHSFWTADKLAPLSKTFDLKSAYKQFAIDPDERHKAVILLRKPGTADAYAFIAKTLLFGASASVYHFNRVARLLQAAMVSMRVLVPNYYDDYPCVSPAMLSKSTDSVVHGFLALLGVSRSEDKEVPFGTRSELLGVVLDSSDSSRRKILVKNKDSRTEEIAMSLKIVLERGEVKPRDMPSLFGRLQFSESQVMGIRGRLALSDLRDIECASQPVVRLSIFQRRALELLLHRLAFGKPRAVLTSPSEMPALIFTDGSCEPAGRGFFWELAVS